MPDNVIEKLKSSPLWPFVKNYLKDVKVSFDHKAESVTVMNLKSGVSHTLAFNEIEDIFNA